MELEARDYLTAENIDAARDRSLKPVNTHVDSDRLKEHTNWAHFPRIRGSVDMIMLPHGGGYLVEARRRGESPVMSWYLSWHDAYARFRVVAYDFQQLNDAAEEVE